MLYEYKTVTISGGDGIQNLNQYYADGWEFVNAIAEIVSTGWASHLTGNVYFTIRRQR